jgi:hypothetical protein
LTRLARGHKALYLLPVWFAGVTTLEPAGATVAGCTTSSWSLGESKSHRISK